MRNFLTSVLEKLTEKVRKKDQQNPILEKDSHKDKIHSKTRKIPKKRKEKEKNSITHISELTGIPISKQKMKLISVAEDIRLDPDKTESAFMARQLVQATLPHKDPGNVEAWSRTNGGLTVSIQPGLNKNQKTTGYPYGTLPRLLMFWLTTEAIRTNSRRIELGNNLAVFMETLGLNPKAGGKRSDVKRLQDQMRRLFHSRISFTQVSKGEMWLNMQVTSKGMLWWDSKQPSQSTLWENWIEIGEDFFKAITSSPVPVDMRALRALKKSPLALDLYAWATYTAYQTQKNGHPRSISWRMLHEQFGAEYNSIKEFSRKAWVTLKKVQLFYPELAVERIHGGVNVLPSKPSIRIKQKKSKKASV